MIAAYLYFVGVLVIFLWARCEHNREPVNVPASVISALTWPVSVPLYLLLALFFFTFFGRDP